VLKVARSTSVSTPTTSVGTEDCRPGPLFWGGRARNPLPRCDCSDSGILSARPVADEGSLGSLTGYCPSGVKNAESATEPRAAKLDSLMAGYLLRAGCRGIATCERIAICGARIHTDPTVLTEEFEDGSRRAKWTGVILCNRQGCPVCSALRARRFGQQVERALVGGAGLWQHVILTVPHSIGESWSEVYDRGLAGLRALSHGRAGIVLRDRVTATIRATETTWSFAHGWHVHFHCLWRLNGPQLGESEAAAVEEEWCTATGAKPGLGFRLGGTFETHIADERAAARDYVSKLAAELAGHGKQPSELNWSLLEVFEGAAAGDARFVGRMREYQLSTKGRRLYQLDRRAKQMHDAGPEPAETVVVQSWVTMVDRAEFSALSRLERCGADPLAIYLPLEVAARARGDPRDAVEDTIYDLLAPRPSTS
jgi:hypothetical protein